MASGASRTDKGKKLGSRISCPYKVLRGHLGLREEACVKAHTQIWAKDPSLDMVPICPSRSNAPLHLPQAQKANFYRPALRQPASCPRPLASAWVHPMRGTSRRPKGGWESKMLRDRVPPPLLTGSCFSTHSHSSHSCSEALGGVMASKLH